jgi:DeoR/GlpR family transcriptional regulator of sugar metabolism
VPGDTEVDAALRYESAPARRERVLDLVREKGYYSLSDLGREFGVSEMTVRRDVAKLGRQGLVRVVHGGVSAVTDLLTPVEFRFRSHQHTAAKRAIAGFALTLLGPGTVVGLDAGTTVLEVALGLPRDVNLTVVTHSLPVMSALSRARGAQLITLGGMFMPEAQAFSGSLALRSLSQLRIQTLLLGAASVHGGSVWSTNTFDAEIKQALMAAADRTVVLADSSKFDYSTLMLVSSLAEVSMVVTDEHISAAGRAEVAEAGSELVTVPVPGRGLRALDRS